MKQKTALFFLASAVIVCLILPIWIGISPPVRIWKDYTVLAVSTETPEHDVLTCLEENNIHNTISISHAGKFLFKTLFDSVDYTTEPYFYDKTGSYRLYYIPAGCAVIERALSTADFSYILNSSGGISYLPVFFTAASFIVFCIFSQNKLFFAVIHAPAVFYVFICPFYSAAAAAALVFFPGYILQKLYPRTGYAEEYLKTGTIYVFYITAAVFIILCGLRSAAAAADCTVLSICLLKLYERIQLKAERLARSFIPVPILNAKKIEKLSLSALFLAAVPAAAAASCIAAVLFFQTADDSLPSASAANTSNRLSIPAPVEYTVVRNFDSTSYMEMFAQRAKQLNESASKNGNTIFYNFSDYLALYWQSATMPYRRVQEEKTALLMPRSGDRIMFPSYSRNNDGYITADENILFTFDNAFIKKTIAELLDSDFPYPEKLMIRQGSFFTVRYITPQHAERELFLVYRLLGILIVPVIYITFFIIKWRKHGTRQQSA